MIEIIRITLLISFVLQITGLLLWTNVIKSDLDESGRLSYGLFSATLSVKMLAVHIWFQVCGHNIDIAKKIAFSDYVRLWRK